MNICASNFLSYLNQADIKYSILSSNIIAINFSGNNCSSIKVTFSFSDNNQDVSITVLSIAEIGRGNDKQFVAYALCNKLNQDIRWLKFYINDDNEIVANSDAIISPDTAGEICTIFLIKAVEIVETTYPIIMKALWTL